MKYEIKNWDKFQQYKDSRPVHWIKLHCELLDNYHFEELSERDQLYLIKLWLFAAKNCGKFEGSDSFIGRKIGASELNMKSLVQSGFILRTEPYEGCEVSVPRGEERREEERREENKELMSGKEGLPNGAAEVLDYLNAKRASNYKLTPSTKKLISARLKEGFAVSDLKRVIDNKIIEWGNSRKMEKFIRPATLFNAEKFSQYSGEPAQDDNFDITKPPSWRKKENVIDGECSNG